MTRPLTDLRMTWDAFSGRYCERMVSEPSSLADRLRDIRSTFAPDGFMLLECAVMDSSRFGHLSILPYGGQATFKTVPDHPISPRGLASDMSVVIGIILSVDVP